MVMLNTNITSVVSPINKNFKSNSNRDYREQCARSDRSQQQMWDDAKGNPTNAAGGLFGFVHNSNRVELHMVTAVCSAADRLESWSDNVGQTDRNVLLLSPCLIVIMWDDWIELGGAKKVQGTARVVGAHDALATFIMEHFRDSIPEYVDETGELVL